MEKVGNAGREEPIVLAIKLKDAKQWVEKGFIHYLGSKYKHQPEYDEVAEWLTDSKGKGLLLYGNCGRGKSMLAELIIPRLLYALGKCTRCYGSWEINSHRHEIMSKKIVVLDDVGREGTFVEYGNRIDVFADIVDNAEKTGQLLIITTNLDLCDDPYNSLLAKYDERVVSRLKKITKTVQFIGDDLRG